MTTPISPPQPLIGELGKIRPTLTTNEERLRLVDAAGRLITWEWSLPDDEIHWTGALLHIFGIAGDDANVTYENFIALVQPDDRAELENETEAQIANGPDEFENEFCVCWADSTTKWLLGRAQIIRNEFGDAVRRLGINADITEFTQQAFALAESESQLRTLTNLSPTGVSRTNDRGHCVFVNDQAVNSSAVQSNSVVGHG